MRGEKRPADFEGAYYDGNGENGGNNLIGKIKMWWKLKKGNLANPYLSGLYLHKCYCGRKTALRLFLSPKSRFSFPSAEGFAVMMGMVEKKQDDPFSDDDARNGGAL